jgi:mycothiol synthase
VTVTPVATAPFLAAKLTHDDLAPGLKLARLIGRITAADGHAPFGEHVLLTLDGRTQVEHASVALHHEGELIGFCVLSQTGGAWYADFAVDPGHRGQGVGTALATAAASHVSGHGGGALRAWGPPTGASASLAKNLDMRVHRTLHYQERSLTGPTPQFRRVAGARLRSLRPEEAPAWLQLSNDAFQGHPENGGWTLADLQWRLNATWTDLARFVVAVDDDDQLLAGVWTKVEPGSTLGELYVVAVQPKHAGTGLGRLVTTAALAALHEVGLATACLYVDEANTAAHRLYGDCGFHTAHIDTCFEMNVPARSKAALPNEA